VEFVAEKVRLRQDFFKVSRLPLPILIPPNASHSYFIWGSYKRPINGLSFMPPHRLKKKPDKNIESSQQTANVEFFPGYTSQSELRLYKKLQIWT
jgi:hypothetical protein